MRAVSFRNGGSELTKEQRAQLEREEKKRAAEEAKAREQAEKEMLKRWKAELGSARKGLGSTLSSSSRQLFLIPTGVPGVNDHTLHSPQRVGSKKEGNEVSCHLWGFCQGLYSRIFKHIVPGDILLFTPSGSGVFDRVAVVGLLSCVCVCVCVCVCACVCVCRLSYSHTHT